MATCQLLWEYWLKVNGEDLSILETYDLYGETIPMLRVESKLLQLKAERCKVQLAFSEDRAIGFLLYYLAYESILIIEGLYVLPEYEGRGVGKHLVESLGKPVLRVYFQTRKDSPPNRLFDVTSKWSPKKLSENERKITWEMPWDCLET